MDRTDQIFFLVLLAMLVISIVCVAISPYMISVYGETESQCTDYVGNEIIILGLYGYSNNGHYDLGCAWLADTITSNSSFNVLEVRPPDANGFERWILTK